MPNARHLLGLAMLGGFAACGAPGDEVAEGAAGAAVVTSIYAGSYPVAYFAERIGGALVAVELSMPDGADPATWTPSPETVLAYQRADLVVLNGAGHERWVATASLPASRVIDTSEALGDDLIEVESFTHSHSLEGEHSHGEWASVTWLDPTLAMRQAESIRDALIAAQPQEAVRFEEGFSELAADLEEVDSAMRDAATGLESKAFLADSPAFAYLARRYGLDIRMIRFDPADPTANSFWHEVEHGISHSHVMLWSSPPSAEVAARLEDLGISPVVLDGTGARQGQADLLDAMRANAAELGRLAQ